MSQQQQLTPQQLAQMEANRQGALEKLRQKAALVENHQPPHSGTQPADKADKSQQTKRLPQSKMSSGYYEYDFSKMHDTRAGFLEESPAAANTPERKRKMVSLDEIPFSPDPDDALKCCECGSIDLDVVYLKVFKAMVCKPCIDKIPDKYSLLTKTEAKEANGELRDRELFPVWEKANPHKSTWNNMLLYMRQHLEAFATKKWDGLDNLDREFERRVDEKRDRKEKKYKQSVANLRRRTRVEEWEKARRERLQIEAEHEHTYESIDSEDGTTQKCTVCGLVIEVEELDF
ncbi:DNA repair protein rad14 [Coemansia sp. RSA 2320]|nr:DNA repair protein rad14 [Coemansia sp. RSA 2320]